MAAAAILAVAVILVVESVKAENRKMELHNNIEKFQATLPSYQDTLVAFDKKYADSTILWENVIEYSDNIMKRDSAAHKLGHYHKHRSEILDKHRKVDRKIAAYRDSLIANQKKR